MEDSAKPILECNFVGLLACLVGVVNNEAGEKDADELKDSAELILECDFAPLLSRLMMVVEDEFADSAEPFLEGVIIFAMVTTRVLKI